MKAFLAALRWIAFIPAGIILGTLFSLFGRLCSFWFPEIIQDIMCGAFGSIGMIAGGLYTAPIRNAFVKWTMILLCVITGGLTIAGAFLSEVDRFKFIVMGLATAITALCYCGIPTNEIVAQDDA